MAYKIASVAAAESWAAGVGTNSSNKWRARKRSRLGKDRDVWGALEATVIARATRVLVAQVQALPRGRHMLVEWAAPEGDT